MGRRVALIWHASMVVVAGLLYFFFVLPRWPEMMGDTSATLGLVLRIVCGVAVGVAALPVAFTQIRTRKPEFTTPVLALTLRTWSIVLQVVAAVLIVGTAVSEVWVDLDRFGQLLFGVYGAAAATALLGFLAFYLSLVAELPPPPPRPIGEERQKRSLRLRRRSTSDGDDVDESDDSEDADTDAEAEAEAEATVAETETEKVDLDKHEAAEDETVEVAAPEAATVEVKTAEAEAESAGDADTADDETKELATTGLRNRRPSGKTGGRRRGRVTR